MQIPEVTLVKGRPIPKDILQFYGMDSGAKRVMVSITDSVKVWQEDLGICERLFGDIVVCPFASSFNMHKAEIEKTRDILKQRMKHPDIVGNAHLESIAKTWILPQKLHVGTDANSFFQVMKDPIKTFLFPIFEEIKTDNVIQFLKIEVPDGMERRLLYSFLDEGFRPSMILVKWSGDLDEDISVAHCAGHLVNTGYSLIHSENGYALYSFRDQPLYDICSVKEVGLENPFLKAILSSVGEQLKETRETQLQKSEESAP
jgi:hypothetical protein